MNDPVNPLVDTSEAAPAGRRQMEIALRESEARLRSLIDSAPTVLWALDRDGIFTFSEGMGLRALGLNAGEVVGRSAFDVYSDIPQVLADCRRALAGEEFASTVELGELVFESRYSTLRDEDGSITGVIGVAIDVTDRKRTETELEQSLSLLRATLESTADGILVVDTGGRIVSFNQKFAQMWNIPQPILDSGDDDRALDAVMGELQDPEAFVRRVRELYAQPESESYDVIPLRDGRTFERFSTPQRLGSEVIGRVWSFRDVTESVRAKDALQRAYAEMENRVAERTSELEAIFHALPDLYFRLDARGRIIECRAGTNADLIAPPEQLIGRAVEEILPPAEAARIREGLRRVRTSDELVCIDYTVPAADGDREFEARLVPFLDGQVITVVRDITDQKNAERQLQSREERFRSMIENAYDLIQIVSPTGEIVYTGPSVYRLLGYTPEEIAGTDAVSYLHPEDVGVASEAIDRFQQEPGGVAPSVRYRVRHKDGRWRVFEAFGRLLAPESPDQGLIINARDITERHEAEEALRRSEEHFRLLIENSSDVASILDASGVNRYQSPSSERVLGYTPEEMIGTSAYDRIHEEDVAVAQQALRLIASNPGMTQTAEFRYRHKNGTWCNLEVSGRTLLPDSAAGGVVINSRDVTERRMAAEALRRAKEEAERANRAKSEFLSRMSHELRTPMNSILGFAQLLAKRELPADQRKAVDHILKAGRHLLNLINEVLDIARIEANRQALSLEPVQVHTVVQEALALVRPMAEQRDCTIDDADLACDDYVHADGQRLMQVLLNLLSNAIKYNRPGGTVRLTCDLLQGEGGAGNRLCIRVHDTGPGIPEDRMDELFIPFSRLGADQSNQEGTGLGLALSQRLVEAMGGQLLVSSTVGVGSTFTVELAVASSPLEGVTGLAARHAVPKSENGDRPATILYVEDNLANLSLIQTIFSTRPEITLVPALQGRLGLELAWEHNPDVILLDLHLPDIAGQEVLRRLRGDARTRDTPIIVISADATASAVTQLVEAGAHAYLTKPLDIDQFLDAVDDVLARRTV